MDVSELGEFGLIERLAAIAGVGAPPSLVVGIGDDCAVWRLGGEYLLATADALVEGVHFLPRRTPWADVGWKALAANVSDVAAMGGEPLFALVTLALPPGTPVEAVDALYGGLRECAAAYGVSIAGGDVVSAPQVSVSVALVGQAAVRDGQPLLLRRDGARPGDVLAVTGTLGASAAGLRRLREGPSPRDPLVRAHLRPRPPLGMAQKAARLGITCAIDISDGLLQDAGHIARMSGVALEIRAAAVPISGELREAYLDDALRLACAGGEDYQVLFAGPRDAVEKLRAQADVRVTVIGEVADARGLPGEGRVRLLDESRAEISFLESGWDHLRQPPGGGAPA